MRHPSRQCVVSNTIEKKALIYQQQQEMRDTSSVTLLFVQKSWTRTAVCDYKAHNGCYYYHHTVTSYQAQLK